MIEGTFLGDIKLDRDIEAKHREYAESKNERPVDLKESADAGFFQLLTPQDTNHDADQLPNLVHEADAQTRPSSDQYEVLAENVPFDNQGKNPVEFVDQDVGSKLFELGLKANEFLSQEAGVKLLSLIDLYRVPSDLGVVAAKVTDAFVHNRSDSYNFNLSINPPQIGENRHGLYSVTTNSSSFYAAESLMNKAVVGPVKLDSFNEFKDQFYEKTKIIFMKEEGGLMIRVRDYGFIKYTKNYIVNELLPEVTRSYPFDSSTLRVNFNGKTIWTNQEGVA